MAQPKGHSIWWLIPGVVILLGILSEAAHASHPAQSLTLIAVALLLFVAPVVIIYKAIQWAQSRGPKVPGQSQ